MELRKFRSFNKDDEVKYGKHEPFNDDFDPLIYEDDCYYCLITGLSNTAKVLCEVTIPDSIYGISFTSVVDSRTTAINILNKIIERFNHELLIDGWMYSASSARLSSITGIYWRRYDIHELLVRLNKVASSLPKEDYEGIIV